MSWGVGLFWPYSLLLEFLPADIAVSHGKAEEYYHLFVRLLMTSYLIYNFGIMIKKKGAKYHVVNIVSKKKEAATVPTDAVGRHPMVVVVIFCDVRSC